ncbi:methionyl-tRNA formyltransferase [Phaeovibrio sulfidiphilus]|uniref:Methionyl-tRNA formyltransferase n=2 Tax=Phaeovibrio sulfidiphilus TaxID=1220600 RepID=A0A8J7CPL9_9PROT|nr:methionyl-tRNA formyltransferase [Phaeovibrio sulfidiphilus]MBE1237157.1 methionyl-tRNA formyltransferase [Phaeovibrio sulfidiphilus]
MGTPDFSVPALRALDREFQVVCVYSRPPRIAGRGQTLRKSAVHTVAEELGIAVRTPTTLRDAAEQESLRALEADVAVVAAYGLLLPSEVLQAPRHGCINIHASLLPRWRGAAPLQRSILAGDEETGICLMAMDEGLDTGDVIATGRVPITAETTGGSLHDELAELGASMIVDGVRCWCSGTCGAVPQAHEGVTYAAKIDKKESRILWEIPARSVDLQIRAFSPYPGAWFEWNGERIRVLRSRFEDRRFAAPGQPGEVLDDALLVNCGDGRCVRLLELQRAGKSPLDADAFLRGLPVPVGSVFG